MSLLGTIAKGVGSGGVWGGVGAALGGIFGGDEGPNVAKKLSAQWGCQILESQRPQVQALIAKGVNPCTQEPLSPGQMGGMPPGYPTPSIEVLQTPVGGGGGGARYPATPVSMAGISGALEFTSTGLVRNVVIGGRRVSRKAAAAFIRKHGFEVAGSAFQLNAQQLARVILDDSKRRRRRRGLSYAQISNARRVMRTLKSMQHALGTTTRRAPARSRSRATASCR